MNKVIFKTAIKTFVGLIIAACLAFGIASLGFPSSMASLCEKTGNFSMAASYASLKYTYSGDIADLARCAEDSILSGSDGKIVKNCGKLVEHEEFADYCAENGGAAIKHYIYGHLAAAKYRRGDKGAFETAAAAFGEDTAGFPVNNALVRITIEVAQKQDAETAEKILEYIKRFTPADEQQQKTYDAIKNTLNDIS